MLGSIITGYSISGVFINSVANSPVGDWVSELFARNYDGILAKKCAEAIIMDLR